MANLTIPMDDDVKKKVMKKVKKDGMTVTFLIHQFFKKYLQGDFEITLRETNPLWKSHDDLLRDFHQGKLETFRNGKEVIDSILSDDDYV